MNNPWIPVGFLLFLAFWMMLMHVISRFTGWAKLALYYGSTDIFQGKTWKFQSIAMRMGTGYNNLVRVGAGPRGLHLSLFFFFRPGHPPLFVRWPEVSVAWEKKWGINRVELRFQRAADIFMIINTRLAQQLSESAGSEWPGSAQSWPGLSGQGSHL